MGNPIFRLPDEAKLAALNRIFPCREPQIRALATLLYPGAAPCRNLVIYGTEATGKSGVTAALLSLFSGQAESVTADDVEDQLDGQLNGHVDDDDTPLQYAMVNSSECITSRHLFETVVGKVSTALHWDAAPARCETVSSLTVELSKMLKYNSRPDGFRFVLVFDAIDRQRDAPHTLLPALARLSEIIPCLTTVFIVTSPPPNFLLSSFTPHLHFPTYTKPDFIAILSTTPPRALPNTTDQETIDLWARFTAAVHDALARAASRTLPSFRHACAALWPRFTAPIHAGTHSAREFSKLLVAARVHFQDERLLDPGVLALPSTTNQKPSPPLSTAPPQSTTTSTTTTNHPLPVPTRSITATTTSTSNTTPSANAGADLAHLLPTIARLLLLASYLASHNPTRHDLTLFSTHYHGRRKRRGGAGTGGAGRGRPRSKHRKIARKLLGAHAFVLERMLAIFEAVKGEWGYFPPEESDRGNNHGGGGGGDVDADIAMAVATLASLRLLVKVGGGGGGSSAGGGGGFGGVADVMDRGGKWRVNVGWEVIKALGRGVGVEVEEWLME
ncbi:origin recognition complex subunit 5 C-terminus-domain-containing protein [Dichotomopilus funicola]|uniref:Origin recognition complex subunit 5 C-terminus-domain-containing protein n=1 Tax=Dichotomopilus funicola TaxID=1934379 RepID=A0AAN6ZP11_9PEZI|nr:origin recognition complex subunit 5 C-terminus-domain-containing protein [Dichotomopilus funicola]